MKNSKFSFFKKISIFVAVLLIIPCIMMFSGCSKKDPVYIVSIEKTSTVGNSNIYTITYSDGRTETLTIENGKDGKDGQDAKPLDTYDLWQTAKKEDGYTGTYLQFLKENFLLNSDSMSTVSNKCLTSVVSIEASNFLPTGSSSPTIGSGLIYDFDENGNALIITNYHVACYSTTPYKYFRLNLYGLEESNTIQASYVGGSATYDIAILKVTESSIIKNNDVSKITFSESSPVIGSSVVAIGNPAGHGLSVARGIISRDSENVTMSIGGLTSSRRFLRHDAFITNGSSGGGLFDMNGHLIGLTNGGAKDDLLINYAIPASVVKSVTENIVGYCLNSTETQAKTINSGLTFSTSGTHLEYDEDSEMIYTPETTKIKTIGIGSLFNNGILAIGDAIKTVTISRGGNIVSILNISHTYEFEEFLLAARAGDTIQIKAARASVEITDSVQITASNLVSVR